MADVVFRNLVFAVIVFFSLPLHVAAQNALIRQKQGMLVLGSDNINTLKERVDVARRLYSSGITFDYIVVSGGCGAHGSTICEATQMANLLIKWGVPPDKIFKEEKSKSTKQNYCYSRILTDQEGVEVINPGDKLFVVSNHWHAISVAARFAAYDSVDAVYHIEGNLVPRPTDKVDYTTIFHNEQTSDDFCESVIGKRK